MNMSFMANLVRAFRGTSFAYAILRARHLALKIVDSTSEVPEAQDRLRQEFAILKSSDSNINLLTAYDITHYDDKDNGIQYV